MRVLSVTEAGRECLREHVEPVHDVSDEAIGELSAAEAELLERFMERVASLKEADAAAVPAPERECHSDGYSRALLM
jgi:hypothetical protein